jgi:CheY-specific phosphatase CheX
MIDTGIHAQLTDSLTTSSLEIFETMVFLTPDWIEPAPASGLRPNAFGSEVIGILGFTGTRSGTVIVCCSEKLCRTIAAKMLMMEPEEITDVGEAADGFGELVNMITGNFKNTWVALGNEMNLSVPTVTQHGEVSVSGRGCESSCGIRLSIAGEPIDITILFARHN